MSQMRVGVKHSLVYSYRVKANLYIDDIACQAILHTVIAVLGRMTFISV